MTAIISPGSPHFPLCTVERPEAQGCRDVPRDLSVRGPCCHLFRNSGAGGSHSSPLARWVRHGRGVPIGGCSKDTLALGARFGC